jgi:hypothetical protein
MEVSLSSIAFKGSVTQAIVAAKIWRKILLVYIGGMFTSSHAECFLSIFKEHSAQNFPGLCYRLVLKKNF